MSWRKVKLGELIDNFSVRAKDVGGAAGLDFLGVSNDEGIIKTKYAAEDKADDYKIIEKGCFAYNPYRVNVGSIGLVSDDTRGLISPAYVVFKPKPNSIIPELLFKFLKSDEGLRQIIFYARGTVRQALRFEDLCNIEISIPDFSEQKVLYKKLVNSQESSNVLNTELKNQLDLVKRLRQQLLRDAVQGKLLEQNRKDEPASELLKKIKAKKVQLIKEKILRKEKEFNQIIEDEIPFEIPENWTWCRLGEVVTQIFDGPFGSHLKTVDYTSSGIQVIRLQNLDEMRFKDEKETFVSREKYESIIQHTVYEGDIIIGSFLADGVKCVVLPKLKHTAIAKADCFTIRIKHDMLLNNFVMFLLSSDIMFVELSKLLRGMTRLRINTTQLKQLPIPLPPILEQIRIVKKLEELMQNCNDLEESIKHSASQNKKLLQQVLREALRKEPVEV